MIFKKNKKTFIVFALSLFLSYGGVAAHRLGRTVLIPRNQRMILA
jgi:hypothetical protein